MKFVDGFGVVTPEERRRADSSSGFEERVVAQISPDAAADDEVPMAISTLSS